MSFLIDITKKRKCGGKPIHAPNIQ